MPDKTDYAYRPALGWSWLRPDRLTDDTKKDPRIRVCATCVTHSDHPDVKIVSVPLLYRQRPRCIRCDVAIGGE